MKTNSWHWKVYCFNSQLVAAWKGKDDYHEYPYHNKMIGLCPYMRMILIWGPLVMLTNIIPLAAIIATFYWFPAGANGIVGVYWLLGSIIGVVTFFVTLAKYQDWQTARREEKQESQLSCQRVDMENQAETFWTLVMSYIKAIKSKVCPVLEIEND